VENQLRKYETIWQKIKDAGEGSWVIVKFSTPAQLNTIINMVQLEKSRANVARRELELPAFGRLVILRDVSNLTVRFTLKNSGDSL
jgi:hypothetical protein